ncbi:response regulator [Chryseosolibacter indicus]|uniref:Response regulator n=1 Tax=Chryseosolibacter indicus TaxID=2782351 RepID=A0ABS5VZ89_9BACT|nr:response regulator [Chryseosolibacter indicus]MBT1706229.1 response regulator [Chryseosolibacter indicus]
MKVKRLYLIDDDEDDVLLFCEALAQIPLPVELTPFTDCRAAFKHLEEGNIPDVIFLDLNMPHIDGKEFMGMLKGIQDFNSPIIIYSTSNFQRDIEDSMALGAADYVIKQGDFGKLCSSLKNVLYEKVYLSA